VTDFSEEEKFITEENNRLYNAYRNQNKPMAMELYANITEIINYIKDPTEQNFKNAKSDMYVTIRRENL
jgi:hypothetical protein